MANSGYYKKLPSKLSEQWGNRLVSLPLLLCERMFSFTHHINKLKCPLKTLTSCGRPDLFRIAPSLLNNQKKRLQIVIHEEKGYTEEFAKNGNGETTWIYGGVGQHNSITQFVEMYQKRNNIFVGMIGSFTISAGLKNKRILQKNPSIINW